MLLLLSVTTQKCASLFKYYYSFIPFVQQIPKSHPRYLSLKTREQIAKGVKKNITSIDGLIAHGRGEAFDYLFKEKTNPFGLKAIESAGCLLLTAKYPVISVNGNVAALCAKEIVELSNIIPAKLEVNLFHKSKKREINIAKHLIKSGAKDVLLPDKGIIKYIAHNRKYCNKNGIVKADVVFVPLEDGDRCRALEKMGKKVITIDLNPLSRTAQTASITIIDNVIRALPLLIKIIKKYKSKKILTSQLNKKFRKYDNKKNLEESLKIIKNYF